MPEHTHNTFKKWIISFSTFEKQRGDGVLSTLRIHSAFPSNYVLWCVTVHVFFITSLAAAGKCLASWQAHSCQPGIFLHSCKKWIYFHWTGWDALIKCDTTEKEKKKHTYIYIFTHMNINGYMGCLTEHKTHQITMSLMGVFFHWSKGLIRRGNRSLLPHPPL